LKCPKNKELKLTVSSRAGHSSTQTISREIPESFGTRQEKSQKIHDQVSGRDRIDSTKGYLAHLRGSERIDVASRGLTSSGPMQGCTCGKPVGFTGQHKLRCPLRDRQADTRISGTINNGLLDKKAKKPKRRVKQREIYYQNLAKAENQEAEDRRRGIREKLHPLRSVFGSLPKKACGSSKILQGGLPELGKRR
jgi:hypothetical protein